MEAVKISPKFQVVIPKNIRKRYKLKSGEKMIILPYEERIEMIREKDIKSMRGFLKNINTEISREDDRT
ncbi:MAG: AbrB/MazE/SpoVT family DNA-binding domain-containing protein [bacterium]